MSNPNMTSDDSATINLKNQFKRLNNEAGKFVNFSLLSKRAVNNDLCIYSYLAKYDRRFHRFVFVFYNNDSNIRLYRYSFDSSIDLELEKSLSFIHSDYVLIFTQLIKLMFESLELVRVGLKTSEAIRRVGEVEKYFGAWCRRSERKPSSVEITAINKKLNPTEVGFNMLLKLPVSLYVRLDYNGLLHSHFLQL